MEPYRARPAIPAVPGAEVTITSEATKRFLTIRIEAWDAEGNALVADNTRGYLVRSSDFDVDAQFGDAV